MQDPPGPSRHGPTVFALREAAAALGISRNTLRRRIAAGQIRAEQVERPQGFVWQVYLDDPQGSGHGSNGTVQQDRPGTVQQGSTLTPPVAGAGTDIMRAEAMAAYTRSLLEPLVQTIERQAERVAELEREVGRLTERLALAGPSESTLTASTAPQSVEPTTEAPTPRPASTTWLTPQRFWLIAALVLVLIGVGVVQVGVALYSLAVQLAMPG